MCQKIIWSSDMMINHSIYKVGFLNLIAPNSFFEISDYFSFRKFWFKFVRLWHSCCPLVSLRTGNRFFLDYIVLIFWSKGQGLFTLLWSPKANKWICCENICHVLLKNLCSANNIARSPYFRRLILFSRWLHCNWKLLSQREIFFSNLIVF